jgi:hypothetical protein
MRRAGARCRLGVAVETVVGDATQKSRLPDVDAAKNDDFRVVIPRYCETA